MSAPYEKWIKKPSKRFPFEKIKKPLDAVPVVIATAFGAGFSPLAPGTMGSLVALPLCISVAPWTTLQKGLFWLFVLIVGTWASKVVNELVEGNDSSYIVIDEVFGMGITAWTVGLSPPGLLVAFILFRIFDIAKLPPVRQIDTWSKSWKSWLGGFGVMADDWVAAIQALAMVMGLQWLGWL